MARIGFSSAPGVKTHAALTDVNTPHLLAELENAVCSETEAAGLITTHETGAKHRWTDEKLLKGAGAGANPDEIDVPAAPSIVCKPDDQIVNNSEVLVNDEDLVIAVGANEVWLLTIVLFLLDTPPDPEIDWAFAVPAGGAVRIIDTIDYDAVQAIVDGTAEIKIGTGGALCSAMFFAVYIGAATAGNLQLQWAQHTATAQNTIMKANSLMLCHQIV